MPLQPIHLPAGTLSDSNRGLLFCQRPNPSLGLPLPSPGPATRASVSTPPQREPTTSLSDLPERWWRGCRDLPNFDFFKENLFGFFCEAIIVSHYNSCT